MKTSKIIVLSISLAIMASCDTYYRIVTTIDRKGGAIREMYANGDSAFLSGDLSNTPFRFDLEGWNITRFDSVEVFDYFGENKPFDVKVSRSANSVDSLSQYILHSEFSEEGFRQLLAPKETLTKKFKWFYTDYTYTSIYNKLDYNAPIPIDKYMSKDERIIFAQGDTKYFGTTNGAQLVDELNDMSDNFWKWVTTNCFEVGLNIVKKYGGEIPDNDREQIFAKYGGKDIDDIDDPKSVCTALDSFYVTDRFSKLYKQNEDAIDNEFENATSVFGLMNEYYTTELSVPGRVLSANAPVIDAEYLKWKVDGMRLLFDDYTLTASYRVVNVWAFVISGLILLSAIILILAIFRKKGY